MKAQAALAVVALLLALPCLDAMAQEETPGPLAVPAVEDAATSALRALCNPPAPRKVPLSEADAASCRKLFQDDVAAARVRQQAYQQQAIDAFATRRSRQKVVGPVPLATFIGEDTLAFGDIVMLDEGPRVYVGKANEPARAQDFVTLDAPRSPHRKRAAQMLRALKR